MKTNLNIPFTDMFGNPAKIDGKSSTVGHQIAFMLFNLGEISSRPLTPDEKFRAYTLSVKIANADSEVELSKEDADFIIRAAGSSFAAGAYGQIKELLSKIQ